MQEVLLCCRRCKKGTRVSYIITGDDFSPVLPNIQVACRYCNRVMYLKKYTEKMLVENSVGGKFYM